MQSFECRGTLLSILYDFFFLKETEQSDAAKDLSLVEGSLVSMTSKEL